MESIRSGGVQGQAWAQMLEFLEANLKQGSASQNPSLIWPMPNPSVGNTIYCWFTNTLLAQPVIIISWIAEENERLMKILVTP